MYICRTQIDVQSLIDVQSSNRRPISNIWPFFTFSNRRPMTSLTYILQMTSHPLGNVFEAMMEKGQDQIPDERFLITKKRMYFIVTVDKILLCLGVRLH
jgi:hypothetical protein